MIDDAKRPPSVAPAGATWTETERLRHDVRTHMTVIKARTQLLRRQLRKGNLTTTDLDAALAHVEAAVTRLHQAVRRWEAAHLDAEGHPRQ